MPTYDYRCDRCGAEFELWQSMSDDRLTVCPATDGPPACVAPGEGPVRKVFSSVGISFKGTGFYKNDHGANAASRKKSEATESSSSSSSNGSKSSEGSKGSSASSTESSSGGSKGTSGDSTKPSKPSKSTPD